MWLDFIDSGRLELAWLLTAIQSPMKNVLSWYQPMLQVDIRLGFEAYTGKGRLPNGQINAIVRRGKNCVPNFPRALKLNINWICSRKTWYYCDQLTFNLRKSEVAKEHNRKHSMNVRGFA